MYTINNNNYFKLRDIGAAFNFGVDWDAASNSVVIDIGKGYTAENTYYPLKSNYQILDFGKTFNINAIEGNVDENGAGYTYDLMYSYKKVNEYIPELNTIPSGFTDGYIPANFEAMNSFASENGLGDTKVYLEGKINDIR